MRGFTLIEAMVAMSVLVILISLAAPSFSNLIASQRVKNASFDVFSSLVFARSEAVARNDTVTVTPAGGVWSNGWTIANSGGTVLKSQNAFSNIAITGPASVSYNGMGRLAAAVTSFNLTGSGVSASNSRCVAIDLSGRPTVKTGTC